MNPLEEYLDTASQEDATFIMKTDRSERMIFGAQKAEDVKAMVAKWLETLSSDAVSPHTFQKMAPKKTDCPFNNVLESLSEFKLTESKKNGMKTFMSTRARPESESCNKKFSICNGAGGVANVHTMDIDKRNIVCSGNVAPPLQSFWHGAVYEHSPSVNAVVYIYDDELVSQLPDKTLQVDSLNALVQHMKEDKPTLVTAEGETKGLFVLGSDLYEATNVILELYERFCDEKPALPDNLAPGSLLNTELSLIRRQLYECGLVGVSPEGTGTAQASCRCTPEQFFVKRFGVCPEPELTEKSIFRVDDTKPAVVDGADHDFTTGVASFAAIYQHVLPSVNGVLRIRNPKLYNLLKGKIAEIPAEVDQFQ
eukprot:Filipodium_phascolosomae@DN5775_c0_g1_i1.p1